MARPDKAAAVAELTDQFRTSQGAVLTEYRGLTVKQLQELRRALGENAHYAVVKNTLTKIAAKEAGIEGFDSLLNGPSAIAFIKGDAVETAKSLRDFARANSPLVIKGGILDGKPLTIAEISKIADLESREVLLGKLAGALLASLQNAAYLFNAPLAQVARLAAALAEKAEQDPSILRAAEEAPAEVAEPVAADDVPTADAESADAELAAADDVPTADAASADAEPAAADDAPTADAEAAGTDDTPAPDAEAAVTAPSEAVTEETPEG